MSGGPTDETVARHGRLPRMAGAIGATETSTTVSTTNAAATAATSPQKPPAAAVRTAAATNPAPPAAKTRTEVQFSHRRTGWATSRRGKSARSPATPTMMAGSGPNTTAANTHKIEPTETSTPGV